MSDEPGLLAADHRFREAFHSDGFAVPSHFAVPLEMLDDVRSAVGHKVGNIATGKGRLTGRSDMQCTFDEVVVGRPGGKDATNWHQDEAFTVIGRLGLMPPEGSTSLTFWIPLHNVTEASGALRYLPQSHRHGLRKHTSERGGRLFIPSYDGLGSQTVALDAGQCVVHHGLVVHRAHRNRTTDPRWAVGIQFRARPSLATWAADAAKAIARRKRAG